MQSDSDNSPIKNRKRNTRSLVVSSSSDDDLDFSRRQKRTRARVSSSSDDSDESVIVARSNKKLRALSESDSSGSSSASSSEEDDIQCYVSKNRKSKKMALRIDSESSDGDNTKPKSNGRAETGSQSSDEESEKCIICFKAFRGVIAHPSGCTHNFHSECLLQWSKTSNTCPIDRVKYTQIIVTGSEGNVVTRHEVSTPTPDTNVNDIEPDDPTFCEVCSQHDRENEMLLCDQCEAGYHMDCLTPPLFDVPLGDWFCPDCSANDNAAEIDHDELNDLLRDSTTLGNRLRSRHTPLASRRIGPRTRAAQRILSTIRQRMAESERYQPSSSMSSRVTTRRRKKSHRRRSARYEVNLVTVEGTTIEVKVAVNTVRRQKKKRKSNASSSGRRRACSSKRNSSSAGLAIDDQLLSGNHTNLRQPLDIFGSRPQLEYFSGWEAEDELDEEGGVAVLRPRNVGVRGMANRKQIAAQILRSVPRRPTPRINVSSAPPDLLSSILDEQAKWHSPNAVIQSNSNGEVKVILPNKETNLPVKKTVGSGEASTSNEGKSSSSSSSSTSHKESGGGGQRNGEASSSVPPLQPPPQPNFSRVYEDEDFDLYADIEPPYVKPMKSYNKKHLAPPPEPPALLLALDGDEGASSPEDAMLVIDDRQTYDPDVPTSPPPSPGQEQPLAHKSEKEPNINVADDQATAVPPVDLSTIRLPSPEPDIDDCPNRVMYSEASVNIARQTKSDSESDKEIDVEDPVNLVNRLSIAPASDSGVKVNEDNMDNNIPDETRKEEIQSGKECDENKKVAQNASDKGDDVSEKNVAKINAEGKPEKLDPEVSDKGSEENNEVKEKETEELLIKAKIKNENKNCDSTDIIESNLQDNVSQTILTKDEKEDSKLEEGEIKFDDDEEEGKLQIYNKEQDKIEKKSKSMAEDEDSVSKLVGSDESIENEEEKQKSKDKGPQINDSDSKNKENDSPDSTPPRKTSEKEVDQEGEDVLELGCGDDERDGLVDITDEEISTYEKSWELEDNQASTEKTAGIEGLETEAISDCEYNIAEDGQAASRVVPAENGPKEEGEIISDEKKVPVAWKKITKAKERSYREKDTTKEKNKKKDKKPKEKRKELERYDVRKIISDKPKKRKVDEFGRDISPSRSHSLSDSRSRSRSRSMRSIRRSRSKSRSRSRKRRSRDRRSRNRSRGKRSRDRSKRRGGKSRSRSDSRRRRSRSKKVRRSRAKSRDKKRRKRDSSISCSSCSCSSCERDRRKNKKLTVIVPNKKTVNSGKEKKKNKYKERGDMKRRRINSPIPSKEVFTSGDNILVSVNFKKSSKSAEAGRKDQSRKRKDDEPKKKKDKSTKENQPLRSIVSKSSNQVSQRRNRINAKNLKPVAIIDLAQSPFREQTLSPKEIIVLTDSDSDDKRKNDENSMPPCQMTGPKTPPEPHIKFNIISSKPQMLRSLANPLLDSVEQMEGEGEEEDDDDERVEVPHKGPNTPPEPPVPYDPFEPTKSRSPTPLQEMEESRNPPTPPGDKIAPPEPPQRPASPPPKPPPETPKTPSPLHSSPPKPTEDNPPEKAPLSPPNNCNDDSMDMGGGDSPYSPGSSDGEDIFEPPLPLTSTPVTLSKIKSRPGSKHLQKLTPSPLKRKSGNKTSTPLKNSKGSKKEVIGLKLDEDQLKILDDLPNSAVEMQVKDKFLKKLNRQERVVEEVKMVLKPHYAKKHVTKEEYKEILRKSVPKICHSRSGEINPLKIQRLIEAYVKKYRHLRKKRKMTTFTAPDSNPLLKPKPKQTMWC